MATTMQKRPALRVKQTWKHSIWWFLINQEDCIVYQSSKSQQKRSLLRDINQYSKTLRDKNIFTEQFFTFFDREEMEDNDKKAIDAAELDEKILTPLHTFKPKHASQR